jgi:hypothetical protein
MKWLTKDDIKPDRFYQFKCSQGVYTLEEVIYITGVYEAAGINRGFVKNIVLAHDSNDPDDYFSQSIQPHFLNLDVLFSDQLLSIKEIFLEELPLFIGWPWTSEKFRLLIKSGNKEILYGNE